MSSKFEVMVKFGVMVILLVIGTGSITQNSFAHPEPEQVIFENIQVWTQTAGPPGGGFGVIEINPENSDVLYAGSGHSFFRSVNAGESWQRVEQIHVISETEELGVRAVVFNPRDSNTVYVATRGGLFKSTDNGLTWSRMTSELEGQNVETIGIDPSEPDTIYITMNVGEAKGNIYKSTDGGENWDDITSNIPALSKLDTLAVVEHDEIYTGGGFEMGLSGNLFHSTDGGVSWEIVDLGQGEDTFVSTIEMDPVDKSHIFIGFADAYNRGRELEELLFETHDGGKTWHPVTGADVGSVISDIEISPSNNKLIYYLSPLHRSRDGGKTWEQVESWSRVEDFGTVEQNTIAIDPKNEDVLYATLMGQGIAKSTDGGESWWLANNGLVSSVITNIVTDPRNPSIVYASGGDGSGTWKTIDRGENWIILNKGGIDHPWVDELTINPRDSNVLFDIADIGRIFKTEDGGETWVHFNNGFSFESIYALAIDPENPDIIYAMNNGYGMFKSDHGGKGFYYLLESPDYSYSIAIDPSDTNIIYSGYNKKVFETGSRVYRSTNAGDGWEIVLEIPGSEAVTSVVVDPQNPNRVYAGATGEEGEIYVSDNKGETWNKLNDYFTMCTVWGQPQLIVDPNNPSIAYAATWLAGTWKTTDAGKTWTLLEGAPISSTALSLDEKNTNVIYLADRSSPTVWKSVDGGQTWEEITNFASDGALLVMRVLADGNTVYASTFYPSLQGGRLYKSMDGGSTWTDITGGLPRGILDLAVDPTDSDVVYLTTNIHGAHKSTDGGTTWIKMENFPDVGAYDIEVDPDDPTILYTAARGGSLPSWFTEIAGITEGITFADDAGVYKSTDSGSTWSKILTTSVSCRAIRRHPDNHNLLFAPDLVDGLQMSIDGGNTWISVSEGLDNAVTTSVAVGGDKIYVGTQGCGVYSGDLDVEEGVVTWQPSRSNKPVPKVYNLQIEVDPTNSKNIFVASYPGGLYASTDGGVTFRDRNAITPSVVVDDPFRQGYYTFAIDPNNPSKMWLGTWGRGIYKSYNSMILNVPTDLFGKHINQIVVDPEDSNIVYAATEEGIFVTKDDGRSWDDISDGLIVKNTRTLAIDRDGKLYAGSEGYGIYIYDKDAKRWTGPFKVENFGVHWHVWDRPLYLYNALLINPFDSDIMYLGTFPTGFYKTTDGGLTWYESNIGFTIDGAFSMTFHPYNKNVIYAGTYNGVSKSEDGAETWRKTDNGMPPEQWVFSIVINPADPNIVYAASKNGENKGSGRDGFRGAVMKSTDGGETWFDIMNGLERNQEYHQLVMYPYNYDILFVSASQGVYMTKNGGESWEPINSGLILPSGVIGSGIVNNVANNLKIDAEGRYMYLGTRGRGVFRADLEKLNLERDPNAIPLHCFNYVQDGDETGVDCGGSCAISCEDYDYGIEEEDFEEKEIMEPDILPYVLGSTFIAAIILIVYFKKRR